MSGMPGGEEQQLADGRVSPSQGDLDDGFDDEEEEDSDCGAPRSECPLCRLEEVEVEHAGAVLPRNSFMRRIMAQELVGYGSLPDHVVYNNIAREYNHHIHKAMKESGLECPRWSGKVVQEHFENHVRFIPRRVVGRALKRLERMAKLVDQEISSRAANVADGELIEAKTVTKQCNIAKTTMHILRDYRSYVKEDMLQTGVANLCRSVELGTTTATEAKELLDRAALVQSAAGGGDRPRASELFEE